MACSAPSPSSPSPGKGKSCAIRLEGVSKSFGYRDVLRDVNLEIPAGSCVAIYGQNGAGKSTLARIIATQWAPTAGRAEILGHELGADNRQIRRRTGMVADQSFLRSELSLDENLAFFRSVYGVDGEARGDELLDRFGLARRRKDPVSTFSQGMVKRANLARSLLHDPELWVLDEPFSGLDQEGQELLKNCIREFAAGGRTVLRVTHLREIGRELAGASIEITDGYISARTGLGGEGGS